MGLRMSIRLIQNGESVIFLGHNNQINKEKLIKNGGLEAKTLQELVNKCDIIFLTVFDQRQVEDIFFNNGLFNLLRKDMIIILSSTLDPNFCSNIAKKIMNDRKAHVLDAPISGMPIGAETGNLTFFVGGSLEIYNKVLPIFEKMGNKIFHINEKVGSGQIIKLCNNILFILNAFSVLEVTKLIKKSDLNINTFIETVKNGTGDSFIVRNWEYLLKFAKNNEYYTRLIKKDLILASSFSKEKEVYLQLLELALKMNLDIPEN